ncbi:MAG: YfhO family protein [Eubacterium sp.]|nr:YfhO family protein [Eubacterium sp.]
MKTQTHTFKKIWLLYTVGFAVMAAGVFWYFVYYGRSMVWDGSTQDGLVQHLQTLMYYSKWLRGAVRTILFDHSLDIPTYSFGLGYGDDILTTLHYYGIGDPFNLLSVFVPVGKIVWLYHILIVLRLYLAGLSFLVFHRYMDRQRVYSVPAYLLGAITYVFSAYGIIASTRHPFFINPMIWFPLILLGTERIRRENKPGLYVISLWLAAVSNFYFLYMIAILTVLYVFWREIPVRGAQAWKAFFVRVGKYLLYAAISALMSMGVLLPVLMRIIGDTRMQREYEVIRFFEPQYYLQFLSRWIGSPSVDTWCCLGYGAAGVLCVIWMFRNWKQNQKLCILTITMTAALMIPYCGYVLNGFAYPSQRWVWAYSLLIGSIVLKEWDQLFADSDQTNESSQSISAMLLPAGLTIMVLAFVCRLLDNTLNADDSTHLLIAALLLLMFAVRPVFRRKMLQKTLVIALVFVSLINMAATWYSWRSLDRISEFVTKKSLHKTVWKTDAMAVANTGGRDEFYRYSGDNLKRNMSLMAGLSTTQYFWSMSTPLINQYMTDLAVSDPKNLATLYQGLDGRTVLNALAGVKYYVTEDEDALPFGYSHEKEAEDLTGKYNIYQNEMPLPFGYTYDSVISEEEWKTLSPVAKEQTMLQAAVVADTGHGLSAGKPAAADMTKECRVTIEPADDSVICEDGRIVITEEDTSVTLQVSASSPYNIAENLLYIKNLDFQGYTTLDFYLDSSVTGDADQFAVEKYLKMNSVRRAKLRQEKRAAKDVTEVVLTCLFQTEDESAVDRENAHSVADHNGERMLYYANARNEFGKGQTDFLLNGGVFEKENCVKTIRITFPETGIYTYDDISLICADLSAYDAGIRALSQDTLQDVDFHEGSCWNATNRITGSIDLDQKKLLCLSMPYNTGWQAYVDGQNQTILRVNGMFAGLVLEPGEHEIELVYETPYLKSGLLLVAFGVLSLILVTGIKRRK